MTGKRYVGIVAEETEWRVSVVPAEGPAYRLDPRLDVANKSPTGFAWGYGGSGPAQLALAILCDCAGPERATVRGRFQEFKAAFVARWPKDRGWEMPEAVVLAWLLDKEDSPEGLSDAFTSGRNAWWPGEPIPANPYPDGSKSAARWAEGLRQTRAEHRLDRDTGWDGEAE